MNSFSTYILPFCSIVLLLVSLVVAFDCLWRTERALSGFIRLLITLTCVALSKSVVFVLNVLSARQYALLEQITDLVSGLLLLFSMLLLFRIIRSLHRSRP